MSITLLDLQQCSVKFGGLTAVSAFDLQISVDDLIGLIGPNGAGKTTVFNVVTGVYRPTAGAITFESASISGLKPSAIARRGIARTFQNIRLFPTLSVFDNVRAGFNLHLRHGLAHALWRMGTFYREENDVAQQVRELLEIFDLSKFADALCSSLSYGDQRRLEIVRALATRLEAKAFEALARVPEYLERIPGHHLRYRWFCLWPALWAVRSLAHARRDREFPWGPRRPKLPRQEVYRTTLLSLVSAGRVPDLARELAAFQAAR